MLKIKLIYCSISAIVLTFFVMGCSSVSKRSSDQGFVPRSYQEFSLKNGLKVLVVQDHSLPYLSLSMMLKTGIVTEPKGKDGVAAMTAGLLDRGTLRKSSTRLAEALNDLATEFDANVSSDSSSFRVSSLAKDQAELLKLFAEIVLEPGFESSEIERLRKEYISGIAKLADNPSGFADRAFEQLLFVGSAYSKPDSGYLKTLRAITRSDIIKYYSENYRPNNAQLLVVGQIAPDLEAKLEALFGKWQPKEIREPAFVSPLAIQGHDLTIVNKSDMVQSQIRMGHFSIPRNHPDFLKVRIANAILGSGFTSRLMSRIRDELGLTYSVSSQFSAQKNLGSLEIKTFTRNEKLGESLAEILKVYSKFHEEGVSAQEVDDAKNFLIGQFPQAIETAESWANNLALLRLYGIPDTYLTEFIPTVKAITVAEVNETIKKYFSPSTLRILVFSTEKVVRDQLTSFSDKDVVEYPQFQ